MEDHHRDAVMRRVRKGVAFTDVEEYINELPLPDEERSVLWLLAWAEQPPARRLALLAIPLDG